MVQYKLQSPKVKLQSIGGANLKQYLLSKILNHQPTKYLEKGITNPGEDSTICWTNRLTFSGKNADHPRHHARRMSLFFLHAIGLVWRIFSEDDAWSVFSDRPSLSEFRPLRVRGDGRATDKTVQGAPCPP